MVCYDRFQKWHERLSICFCSIYSISCLWIWRGGKLIVYLRDDFIVRVEVFGVCNIYSFLASEKINFSIFIIFLANEDSLVERALEELLDIFQNMWLLLDLAIWTGTISSNSKMAPLGESSTQVVLLNVFFDLIQWIGFLFKNAVFWCQGISAGKWGSVVCCAKKSAAEDNREPKPIERGSPRGKCLTEVSSYAGSKVLFLCEQNETWNRH